MQPNVVLAHGCFDLLHLGHIRHLKEASSLGDKLVVSITADKHVNKGPGRPQFSAEQRREALLMLDCVDEVVINDAETAVEMIKRIKPAVYVKGIDYASGETDGLAAEREAVEAVGGRFHVTTAEKWSSSQLLRSVRLPEASLLYLETARKRGFLDKILKAFEQANKLKIVFVGETIIDEYRYVKPLAKPSKEFILATVAAGSESFQGGVVAAARHGDWSDASIVTSEATITKTRFIDRDFSRKLFEVYSSQEIDPGKLDLELLHEEVVLADLCIALDFGHGLFDKAARHILKEAKYLALTAQTNAGNFGFNPITKYEHAHYVCIDEPEARLAAGHQGGTLDQVMFRLVQCLTPRAMTITRGRYGSASRTTSSEMAEVPAFADSGFDTMGAGDAFIAVAAPLVAVGLPVEMAAFAGNVAGGLKTAILGHRQHVGRDDIVKNVEWLLK